MQYMQFALEEGGPKRLEISWRGSWEDVRIRLDGRPIGSIAEKTELEAGRQFPLPDGTTLKVQLVQKFPGSGLQVLRDGQPVPRSTESPGGVNGDEQLDQPSTPVPTEEVVDLPLVEEPVADEDTEVILELVDEPPAPYPQAGTTSFPAAAGLPDVARPPKPRPSSARSAIVIAVSVGFLVLAPLVVLVAYVGGRWLGSRLAAAPGPGQSGPVAQVPQQLPSEFDEPLEPELDEPLIEPDMEAIDKWIRLEEPPLELEPPPEPPLPGGEDFEAPKEQPPPSGKQPAEEDVEKPPPVPADGPFRRFAGPIRSAGLSESFESTRSVLFSLDGRYVLSPGSRRDLITGVRSISVWDVETGRRVRTFGGQYLEPFRTLALSPDGRQVLTGGSRGAYLCEIESGKLIRRYGPTNAAVHAVAFSPDGRHVISGGDDQVVRFWDIQYGNEVRRFGGYDDVVRALAVSPNGQRLVSAGNAGVVYLWDTASGEELHQIDAGRRHLESLAFSPDGRLVAIGGPSPMVWDISDFQSDRQVRRFEGPAAHAVAFSPDGKYLLSASPDGTMRLWDVATGRELRRFSGAPDVILSVAFSPDGRFAVSGGDRQPLCLWDVQGDQPRQTPVLKRTASYKVGLEPVTCVAVSSDGRWGLSGGLDETVHLWDLESGGEIRGFYGHEGQVWSLAFSPDGRRAVSAGRYERRLFVWETDSGRELGRFKAHHRDIRTAAFSPDGELIVSGGDGGILQLWNASTGQQVRTFVGHTDTVHCAAFSADGQQALSASADRSLRLWDVATGRQIRLFEGHTAAVRGAAFSTDGKQVISCSEDKTIRLWDTATGKEIRRLEGHTDSVSCVAFSPDDGHALSGSDDHTLALWDVTTGREIGREPAITVRSIAFLPDGRHALTAHDCEVTLWQLDVLNQTAR